MKTLTVSNLHGYHIGQSQPSEVVASLRSYVTLSIGDVSERTSLSADESTYPMWHDKLNLRLPERQEDGVLTVKVFARRPLDLPDHEIGRGEVSLAKIKSGAETTVPLQHVHHHKRAHTGDISFVAHHDGTHSSGMPSQDAAVPGTAGVTGGGASVSDIHGVRTGKAHPANAPGAAAGVGAAAAGAALGATAGSKHSGTGTTDTSAVPATAGYTGGGATVTDEHGVKTGKAHPDNVAGQHPVAATGRAGGPQDHSHDEGVVPATAGYSGGGATVTKDTGVPTGKAYTEAMARETSTGAKHPCNDAIHASGGAGGPCDHPTRPSAGPATAVGGYAAYRQGAGAPEAGSLTGAGADKPLHTTGGAGGPQDHSHDAGVVLATAGYSGGGATVTKDTGVPTGKAYPGAMATETSAGAKHPCNEAIHASGGAGGPCDHPTRPSAGQAMAPGGGAASMQGAGAASGSVIGAGADKPVQTIPLEGASAPPGEKPSVFDRARAKTAALAHGVQEDLHSRRQKLADSQARSCIFTGSKPSKVKELAHKVLDKTTAALESAKQKVTKHRTAPGNEE